MNKIIIFLSLFAATSFSQTDNYICQSKVKDTCFLKLLNKSNKKYAVIEIAPSANDKQIGENLRNIIIERMMELGNFEKILVSMPDSNRNECLLFKTKVADFNCKESPNGFAVGLMFGLVGAATMMAGPQGKIAVKTEVIDGRNDSLICAKGFISETSRGTSSGNVPYKSIVCIAEAITKYAISINIKIGD